MKNKTLIRSLLLLLVFVMAFSCLVGCKNEKSNENETNDQNVAGSDDLYDANGYLKDQIPSNVNFGGSNGRPTEITILTWDAFFTEYIDPDITNEAYAKLNEIDRSVYERDDYVQERLNVSFNYIQKNGRDKTFLEYVKAVEDAQAGGDPYDVVTGYTRSIASCAAKGLLYDLNALEKGYLNLDNPWWNKNLRDAISLQGTEFFCTGDASTSFVQMIYCVYFNATIIENHGMASPYDMVKDNEWTMENMLEMGMFYYQDLNDNGAVDLNDQLPITGQYFDYPAFLHGCGVGYVAKDATGNFILNPEVNGEKAFGIHDDLLDWVDLAGAYVGQGDQQKIVDHFASEKSMFLLTQSSAAVRYFSDKEFEYGCVPMPKYDSDQTEYICAVDQKMTMFGIGRGVHADRIEMASTVLEALGSESYRVTTPMIFDTTMQLQKSKSAEMREMLGLIRDTGWFDFARIYAQECGYIVDRPGMQLQAGATWANYMNNNAETIAAKIDKLNTDLLTIAGKN